MTPLWSCGWAGCELPAVQRTGDCLLCNRHLCRTHLGDQWHKCPKPETNWKEYSVQYAAADSQRLDELCRRINGENLCACASQLRGGVQCAVDLSPKKLRSLMGGQNCHAGVVFTDGVVWLARLRLSNVISPLPEVRDYVLRSEAATMLFLKRHTRIPSPRVFGWACESDPGNAVGVGYILMEKLEGTPLDWQNATTAQREKVVRQLADIMLEIERHPFDRLGSLTPMTAVSRAEMGMVAEADPHIEVQSLAQHSTFRSGENGRPLGPFRSSKEAIHALVEAYLGMIASGEIGTAENAADVFLAHRFRLDVLDEVWKSATGEDEKFFLKHADDKGDHIFVNKDFDIVGIIDWEWCSIVSKEEAFASPCMMWPVAAFYDGLNELADEEFFLARVFREKGREDLARCVLDGRKVQRLFFALGPGGALHGDESTLISLFMGLKRAFDPGHDSREAKGGRENEEWEAWRTTALMTWKGDELLQAVLKSAS
ncbi:hypothetical protein B0T17DRAFT_565496 [Bombardia bombarda]|uniref:Aminoglycoside phosphotransferase domain-containing protein n=1 Tax=Bombardia bombarda TaxID=252184 RepID=A0AA39TWV0_9PEZI|nr:hypothetical protein B0T17DRAFT_565496 [Bombardia bombarda]